jgi:hypothetical protein
MPDPVLTARANIGNAIKRGDPEGERLARQELAEARLERAVREALANVPPLTSDARHRAVAMLTGDATHA